MSRLCVVPIVEGHGEVQAVRILLERVWTELLGGEFIDVLRPIRRPRSTLVSQEEELRRAIELAALKLHTSKDRRLILLLLDADDDPQCELAPRLASLSKRARPDVDIAVVLASPDYETWFVASLEALRSSLELADDIQVPTNVENMRRGKSWLKNRLSRPYSETVDQPSLTAAIDLAMCRERSASFDKLCRELEKRLT